MGNRGGVVRAQELAADGLLRPTEVEGERERERERRKHVPSGTIERLSRASPRALVVSPT